MSDEVPLREYVETLLKTEREFVMARFEAMEKAISRQQIVQDAHDARTNGLQGKLDEQAKQVRENMISREEYQREHKFLTNDIDWLKSRLLPICGGIIVIAFVIQLLIHFLRISP